MYEQILISSKIALCGGTVLQEALELSFDRLLMMMIQCNV